MSPRTLTAPLPVRGDVPGLLVRGMPILFRAEAIDGDLIDCAGVVLDDAEPSVLWRVANVTEDVPADLYGDDCRDIRPDWSSPLAVYAALNSLADRGHPCLWMLPTSHGGRTASWTQAAILVSVSVGRVAKGWKPVTRIYVPSVPEVQPDGIVLVNGYRFPDMFAALAEIDKNKANALDDGAALLGEDGAVVVGVPDV